MVRGHFNLSFFCQSVVCAPLPGVLSAAIQEPFTRIKSFCAQAPSSGDMVLRSECQLTTRVVPLWYHLSAH